MKEAPLETSGARCVDAQMERLSCARTLQQLSALSNAREQVDKRDMWTQRSTSCKLGPWWQSTDRRLSHEDHDASSCTSRGIGVVSRSGAALVVCVERRCRISTPTKCCKAYPAQSIWTKPHLVALDEPTTYLDVETVLLAQKLSSC